MQSFGEYLPVLRWLWPGHHPNRTASVRRLAWHPGSVHDRFKRSPRWAAMIRSVFVAMLAAMYCTSCETFPHVPDPPPSQLEQVVESCARLWGQDARRSVAKSFEASGTLNLTDTTATALVKMQTEVLRTTRSAFEDDNFVALMTRTGESIESILRTYNVCLFTGMGWSQTALYGSTGGSSVPAGVVVGETNAYGGWFVRHDGREIVAAPVTGDASVGISVNLFNNNSVDAVLSRVYLTIEEEIGLAEETYLESTSFMLSLPPIRAHAHISGTDSEETIPVSLDQRPGEAYAYIERNGSSGSLWLNLTSNRTGIFEMSLSVVYDVGGETIESSKSGIEIAFANVAPRRP